MKEISEMKFPEDRRYTKDHEWAVSKGKAVRVGISDYAQDQLGDIVFVELPQAGDEFQKGDAFGTVESVKAVSELYMPIGGKILSVNPDLEDAPEKVNQDPYGAGWMVDVEPEDADPLKDLLTREAYLETLKG